MINFFRHIRQRMIKENRVSKYLLYAFGEIVLVVIGILIALQINTWNENSKLNKEEKKLLNSLNEDFKENEIRLGQTIALEENMLRNSRALLKVMRFENETVDSDSIAHMVVRGAKSWWRAEYVTGTYKAILGSGNINVLKNDDLKKILAQFLTEVESGFEDHEESISYLVEFNKLSAPYSSELLLDSQLERLDLVKDQKLAESSTKAIITNKIFQGLLIEKTVLEENRIHYQYKIQGYIEEILEILESELDR
jgi:hypothetical protein